MFLSRCRSYKNAQQKNPMTFKLPNSEFWLKSGGLAMVVTFSVSFRPASNRN